MREHQGLNTEYRHFLNGPGRNRTCDLGIKSPLPLRKPKRRFTRLVEPISAHSADDFLPPYPRSVLSTSPSGGSGIAQFDVVGRAHTDVMRCNQSADVRRRAYDCTSEFARQSKHSSSAHPGNLNAMKSGVYSARIREELADMLVDELQVATGAQVFAKADLREIAGLHALRDLLDADIAAHGTSNRRGEERRQVGSRIRVSALIERWEQRIERNFDCGFHDRSSMPASHVEEGQLEWDRYRALRGLALGELGGSASVQVSAIEEFLSTSVPRRPRIKRGNEVEYSAPDEISAQDHGAASLSLTEEREHDRERCMDILQRIATRRRADATPKRPACRLQASSENRSTRGCSCLGASRCGVLRGYERRRDRG